jgi:ATP-dependent DNA helicase PIF1
MFTQALNDINNFIIDMLLGDKHVYPSTERVCTSLDDANNANLLYPVELINQFEPNDVHSHMLVLKIKTPIMLSCNLNPTFGLCNEIRLIITQLAKQVIKARIMAGFNIKSHVFISRIVFSTNDEKCQFTIKRREFPIIPCYATTINKS